MLLLFNVRPSSRSFRSGSFRMGRLVSELGHVEKFDPSWCVCVCVACQALSSFDQCGGMLDQVSAGSTKSGGPRPRSSRFGQMRVASTGPNVPGHFDQHRRGLEPPRSSTASQALHRHFATIPKLLVQPQNM